MSHTTTFRRTASALGATALLGMALAAPAMAAQDPGDALPAVDATTTSQFPTGLDRERREGNASSVDRERQLGGFTYSRELSTLPQEATAPQSGPTVVIRDDDPVAYIQVGAGMLAGFALAGAAAAVVSRRNHRGLTPA
jgi:hypothetical protein